MPTYRGESPYASMGRGFGGFISALLGAGQRKREEEDEDVRSAYERATLTGDSEELGRLRETHPRAIERLERERGISLPPLPVPAAREGMMELGPSKLVGDTMMPPAMGMRPEQVKAGPMAWPTTPGGVQARAMQEKIAGRELPGGLAPKPTDYLTEAMKAAEAAPQGEKQNVYDVYRKAHKELPELKWTDKPGKPATPPVMMAAEQLWKLTTPERALLQEQGITPDRPPDPPEPEKPRALSVRDFVTIFDVDAVKAAEYQLSGKIRGTLELRTDPYQPKLADIKFATAIAGRTGEDTWEVLAGIATGTYDWTEYQTIMGADQRVQELKLMLSQTRALQQTSATRKTAKSIARDLADLLGITYQDKTWFQEMLMTLTTAPTGVEAPGKPMTAEEAAKRGIRR